MRDRIKRQVFTHLPVYTGDVSGVCSALYEYGGLTVMHDPSGCNSTYNTHDETRWDERESLIFLSGLKESEAVLGDDSRLIQDVADVAKEAEPSFIAVTNSPIPYLIGTDFSAIVRLIEEKTGIPTFHVPTNAMHDYTIGAGAAFLALTKKILSQNAALRKEDRLMKIRKTDSVKDTVTVNILGFTPLDFPEKESLEGLKTKLKEHGFAIESVFGADRSVAGIFQAKAADVNLVISSTGMKTAEYLEEYYGIPYVAGIPVGAFAPVLYETLKKAAQDKKSKVPYLAAGREHEAGNSGHTGEGMKAGNSGAFDVRIVGEAVISGSLAASYRLSGEEASAVVTTEETKGLLGAYDRHPVGECEIKEALSGAKKVVGDPLFAAVLGNDTELIRMPHFAYSGRLFQREEWKWE